MRLFLIPFFGLLFLPQIPKAQAKVYNIILETGVVPGRIDANAIQNLKEPYKGLLALYSAMGGTNCDGENCELTTALGLGKQGSDMHEALIKKYFATDKVAQAVLAQHCYLRPSGASTFTDYEHLFLSVIKDTVKVNYKLMYYDHGKSGYTKGSDVYVLKGYEFKMLKRKLWSEFDRNAVRKTKSTGFVKNRPFHIVSATRSITNQSSAKDTSPCNGPD